MLKFCSCSCRPKSRHAGVTVHPKTNKSRRSRHYASISLEDHNMFSSRKTVWICRKGPAYLYKTVTHEYTNSRFQSDKLRHTLTCPVSCVIHFTGIMLSKAINECAVRIACAAFTVIWLPPVCCCAANMRHSACQLAQNQAGPTDYRIQRFSYSQQNVLVASRRWKHWKLTHEIYLAHLCQKFSFL